MSDVKISFNGTELSEFDGDKVLCRGCKRTVELYDAVSCLLGDEEIYLCSRCLEIIKKVNKEGRTATAEDLMAG